jgi:MOSC domain-containing protein YiiM
MVDKDMHLLSINIGQKRTQHKGDKLETTGIYKLPTREPTRINTLGIEDDFIGDQEAHGGPDQAVYIYGMPDYVWWGRELGKEMTPGMFGDNLTISSLESAQYKIGDRFHIGSVVLEVTSPRRPCATLAARMDDPQFVKKYQRAERPGLYCRVIREGIVQTGDEVGTESYTGETIPARPFRRSSCSAIITGLIRMKKPSGIFSRRPSPSVRVKKWKRTCKNFCRERSGQPSG